MGCKESKLDKETGCDLKVITILPVLGEPGFQSTKNEKSPKGKENLEPKNGKNKLPKSSLPAQNLGVLADRRINAKYKFKANIGKGSFSKVIRVEEKLSRQPYAIKIIESSIGSETFEAELTVLRRVSHPNVIKLIEVFDSNNTIYMVMELATGGSLLDRLETCGHYSEPDSKFVLKMVLDGIAYLHKLGITHRDLKPDNLLYYHPGKDSKILITDFGFASTRKPNGDPYMHTVCGTPQYAAPEVVSKRPYTSAVDMWAIGVITYIVLSGMFPFDAQTDYLIYRYILKGDYSFTDSVWEPVSEEGKNFIQQLLQNRAEKRLTADQASHHPWMQSLRGGSPSRSCILSTSSGATTPLRRTNSQQSSHSAWSSRSPRSLRSDHRMQKHLEAQNQNSYPALRRPLNISLAIA